MGICVLSTSPAVRVINILSRGFARPPRVSSYACVQGFSVVIPTDLNYGENEQGGCPADDGLQHYGAEQRSHACYPKGNLLEQHPKSTVGA